MMSKRLVGLGFLVLTACDPGPDPTDAPLGSDAPVDTAPDDAPGTDTPIDAAGDAGTAGEANIADVLACGRPAGVAGMERAGRLQLHVVDVGRYPDALCNDGTAANLYYRPYRGEANRNRWVVGLRGGGFCGNADDCASRWCSCDSAATCPHATSFTNFDLNNMSGGGLRSVEPGGVMLRDGADPNPLQDYNHIHLTYCSSDSWIGAARATELTTTHPRTGAPATFRIHFLGSRILAADLSILRQDGVPALAYTLDGGSVPMPDLDEAIEVIVVGDSAGGAGTIQNLDRIAAELIRNHAGGGMLDVAGVIDAATGPAFERLDWSMSRFASVGATTYPAVAAQLRMFASNDGATPDESCLSWHAANRPGSEGECFDHSHVLRHHITTPFFVRMALRDSLVSGIYEDSGAADPMLGPFTRTAMGIPATFAIVTQREMRALPMLASTAEEGTSITVAPGVFAPSCPRHDTIYIDEEVYGTSIDPGTGPLTFYDVFVPWRSGSMPTSVVTMSPIGADTRCAAP